MASKSILVVVMLFITTASAFAGYIISWGETTYFDAVLDNIPLGSDFVSVTSFGNSALALRSDGTYVTWGINDYNILEVPVGVTFRDVSFHYGYALGVTNTGSIISWGEATYFDAVLDNIPLGNDFASVTSFDNSALALKSDGTYVAWGINNYNILEVPAGVTFSDVSFDYGYALGVTPEPATSTVAVDIKPGSCPNILNAKKNGVLLVAILGSENFDVTEIDVLSVQLAGIAAIRSNFKDVATALESVNECECYTKGSDGYLDLIVKFDTAAILEAIGEVTDGDEWILELTGELYDETAITGKDCVIIRAKPNPKSK